MQGNCPLAIIIIMNLLHVQSCLEMQIWGVVNRQVLLDIHIFESQWELVSFEAFLKK